MTDTIQQEEIVCRQLNRESAVGAYLADELLSHCLRMGSNSMSAPVERGGRQYVVTVRPADQEAV